MIVFEITKIEPNENFEKEIKQYNENRLSSSMPEKNIKTALLSVSITEEQFDAIRKAVLEVF